MRKLAGWFPVVGWLALVTPMLAHHEIAAKFDPGKVRTLNGVVTRVDWANPHVHVLVNVREGSQLVNWAVELESQLELERSAWKRDTVKPGDTVTVQGPLARDGSHQVWGTAVRAANGRRIFAMSPEAISFFRSAANPRPSGPAPRWPDGKPRLGAAPGETGYWARPSATGLKENGVSVDMDEHGLLKNLNDAAKVAPFQQWARDLFILRQRNFMKDDPMFLLCLPAGAVRQFQLPWGVQFLEEKDFGRIFVMAGGGNHDWHFIYTDGRVQPGDSSLYYGNAVGKWEGDTLIVDSKGFNERFWFSNGGLPHTEKLHLVERFTRTDRDTMKYEVTIDDPGAYTRPWSAGWTLQWVANEELPAYYCQENRA